MAPHSSTLAWRIPWMEEPGRLQSMGSQRVGHDWAISLLLLLATVLSAVPSNSFTRWTNIYWMPIICKVLWTKYTKASVLKFVLVKRYFISSLLNQGPGIGPSEKVKFKQILEEEATLAGRSVDRGRVPGDGSSESRDLSAGVCFLWSRSSGSVWLKLLEWLRGKWEGISRARQSSVEDVVSCCEDLNFYSELNVESSHDFDQNSDLVWPNMNRMTLGSHVENRSVGLENWLGN